MTAEMARGDRRAAVVTVSDGVSAGVREDASGSALAEGLAAAGWEVVVRVVVPDEVDAVAKALVELTDERDVALVLTTGGTGVAPRDVTPDATARVTEREIPGIAEALRAGALATTPHGMLSRAIAGVRGRSLIVNLPGSPRGATEGLAVLEPVLEHAVALVADRPIDEAGHRAADR